MAENACDLSGVNAVTLAPLVGNLLGEREAVVVRGWSCRPLGGGAGEGLGLYQVTGSARVGSASWPWALVVKVCAPIHGARPKAWDYPAREGLAYASGLLALLPGGLAAPRCMAVEARPDGTSRLWLEAVADACPGPWPLDRYALVARGLGVFNGSYLAGAPLPADSWLSQGWLRSWVEATGPVLAELGRLAAPGGNPLVQQLYPPPVIAAFQRIWTEREQFLSALERLPRTFCHNDAFRRNLLHRAESEGNHLVAVDWAYAGQCAVGEEIVQLVVASLLFFEAVGIAPRELDATCFASYVAGLREAGWAGDERLVRLGFTAAAALRNTVGLLHLVLPALSDPNMHPVMENIFGRPLELVVGAWAELWPFQLELAEEARSLLLAVG